ncbi:RHS repeat-associated core domain-containing protein [Methanosarcina siciliae]|nr:RHS repeat-associated core domain-containing protein [Methanosarcina siciliae]
MVDETGLEVERTDYFPYGQVRSGGLEKYGFTGQENDADTGLMYYGARYYSPGYRVFVQPDTMLPDPYNPQALNRYSYALNNPVKYTDPSGHYVETAIDLAFLAMDINDIRTGNADKWTYIGLATDVVCAALPGVTGGRLGVQALEETVTHADNVGDLFKLLDKTADSVDTVVNGEKKAEKGFKVANNFIKLSDDVSIKPMEGLEKNPLENLEYTKKVMKQMEKGDYHNFPTEVDKYGNYGKVGRLKGGDGVLRTKVSIEGTYDGKNGVFEYIIEPDGTTCNHRLFKPYKN